MDTWDQMKTWELVLPPSRPSAEQLAHIVTLTRDVNRLEPVAVLGSTPEFRDLLYEQGFRNIHIMERNTSFYDAMSQVRVYRNPELLIEGDWRETLADCSGRFALILSDLTMGNIPYEDRVRFFTLISRSLSKSGLFCDKVLTHPGPNLSVERLIEKYAKLPLNLIHINYFSCEMFFCSELVDLGEIVDSSYFYSILDKRVQHERVRAFLREAKKITPEGCKWYYGRRWYRLEPEYCPDLRRLAVDEDEPSSPYFGRLKQFTLIRD